ncbi:GTP 3',8-cyclase MoaA [Candidatus Bipolaricaulota bacterium]|nr:GTP 3',8-cyclase MoaA [Candidatus Bipolaricaulota bacterium]
MEDSYGREINYMRLSITDRCNFRCQYCMPEEGVRKIPHEEIISFENIVKLVRAGSNLGIEKIRLTGGEPLTRTGVPSLVRMIHDVDGIDEISMTTNGARLSDLAPDLARSGLDRVNVSLDAVDPGVFSKITRLGNIEDVVEGIREAKRAGLSPVKLNAVIVRGLNESEILPLIDFAVDNRLTLRFIELMPMGEAAGDSLEGVPIDGVMETVKRQWTLSPFDGPKGNGPATYYRVKDGEREGTIGFIFPMSKRFCRGCNRIRMTSRGTIRPCLARDKEYPLDISDETSVSEIEGRLAEIIRKKPYEHEWEENRSTSGEMSEIGG